MLFPGAATKKVKPSSLLHKRDLRSRFRASSKVSPAPSLALTTTASPSHDETAQGQQLHLQSIVLHDPLTDTTSAARSKGKKSNLLHTIKIYLHGKSPSPSIGSPNDTIDAIDRGNSTPAEDNNANNNAEPDWNAHYQFGTLSDRSLLFHGDNPSASTIKGGNSVNTSLTVLSATAGRSADLSKVDANRNPQSGEAVNIPSCAPPQPMSSQCSESAEEGNCSAEIVDLDSEFREVLQFNIGQSVRPLPRALLRHVTSIESDNGEEEAEEEKSGGSENLLLREQQPRGRADNNDDEAEQRQTIQCVSSDNGNQAKRSMRLIPFHNLQDKLTGVGDNGETARAASAPDSTEFQSLLNNYPGAEAQQLQSGSAREMPAHGDLIMDEANTVVPNIVWRSLFP